MDIARSINDTPIRLTRERWFHITENHDELAGYYDDVLYTIENPDLVVQEPEAHSDIDLAVISDWFEGKPAIENLKFLSRIAARYNTMIEALAFTEKEYQKIDQRCLLARIVQTGKKYKKDNRVAH